MLVPSLPIYSPQTIHYYYLLSVISQLLLLALIELDHEGVSRYFSLIKQKTKKPFIP